MVYANPPFDPKRNEVYVKVTPTADIRKALGQLVPERLDVPTSDLAIELAKDVSMTCRADGQIEKGAAKLMVSVFGGEGGDVLFAESRKVRGV